MSHDTPQPEHDPMAHDESDHIDAVLEPITPSSRYEHVVIEQAPIPFAWPFAGLLMIAPKGIRGLVRVLKDQWKSVLIAIVLLVVAELALRSLEPRLAGRIYDATRTGGHPAAINAQGFRGDPVAMPKPQGTTRILALGDSVTFGTGIGAESTWPAQLGQIMSTPEHPVDVINAALPALDLEQIELELRTRWADYNPDQVVLAVTGNMVSFTYARRGRKQVKPPAPAMRTATSDEPPSDLKSRLRDVYASLALPGALTMGMEHLKFAVGLEDHDYSPSFPAGVMPAFGYAQPGTNEELDELVDIAWARFASQLYSLKRVCDELGLPLTVVYAPPRFTISDSWLDNTKRVQRDRLTIDPSERLADMCVVYGVDYIDPREALRDAPRPVYVLSDYTHFDRSGNHAIAQLIARRLSERLNSHAQD